MRRNDFSGAKAWTGAISSTRVRIVCKLSGRKMSRLFRPVMRRVFDGGVGWETGGRLERSRVRPSLFDDELEAEDEEREGRGEVAGVGSMAAAVDIVFKDSRLNARSFSEERGRGDVMNEVGVLWLRLSRKNGPVSVESVVHEPGKQVRALDWLGLGPIVSLSGFFCLAKGTQKYVGRRLLVVSC
jgi:hypothetical protein